MEIAEGEVPNAAKLRKLRVVDLRKRLHAVSLPQAGNKEELISRLRQFYLDQQAEREQEMAEAVNKEEEEETVKMSVESEPVQEEEKGEEEEEEDAERQKDGGAETNIQEEKVREEEEERVEEMQVEPAESAGSGSENKLMPDNSSSLSTENNDIISDDVIGSNEPDVVNTEEPSLMKEEEEEGGGGGGGEPQGGAREEEEEKEKADVKEDEEENNREEEEEEEEKEPVKEVKKTEEAAQTGEGEVEKKEEERDTEKEEDITPIIKSETAINLNIESSEPAVVEQVQSVEPVQSSYRAAPKSDPSLRPLATSDYYSDSAREELTQQPPAQNPQIAQTHPQIVPDHSKTVQPISAPPPPSEKTNKNKTKEDEVKGKKKKKRRRRRRHNQGAESVGGATEAENEPPEVEVEYVQENLLKPGDDHYKHFHKIFEAFKISEGTKTSLISHMKDDEAMSIAAMSSAAQKKQREEEESDDDEEETKEPKTLSKKKLRKLNRLTVAQLKQLVDRPDVVEMHDVTAQDPKLLIHLKSTRNTVPVPRHWCFKRKYLQGKRGIEKPPFNLPEFIKATGIMEMRSAVEEKEDAKSLKQKTRERVRPKMGKLTIDYQKLHDAFFRWQTKPRMTIHGDLYYEGKEFETRLKEKKPGDLSEELRRALGMPTGLGKQKFPPPWLVAMQRYGPPPSYPNLKIPGLNAPIPEGCSFGYFVGGWGKPPVDETGRPLYGDVFGLDNPVSRQRTNDDDIDKQLWGELESEEEMEEEEESEEEEEAELKPEEIQAGLITPLEGGLVTPSGLTSIPAGLETPEMIQLRKKKIEEAMEQGGDTPALYTVLPEKSQAVGGAVMGSSHVYDISSAVAGATKKAGGGAGGDGVEVALDPSELDLDAATMTARYEEQIKETKLQKEDLSDMVAEHAAKQKKRKRTATDTTSGKASKKLKEFKF